MSHIPHSNSTLAKGMLIALGLAGVGFGASLEDIIRSGLENNRQLGAQRQEVHSTSLDTLASTTAVNPHLEVEAMHNLDDPARPTAGIRISKEFQPGIRNRMRKASMADWEARGAWLKVRELELVERIRSAYYEWQILNRRLAVQREVIERWERLARLATNQVSQGKISEVDQAEAQLNALKARQAELALQSERMTREQELDLLTGRSDPPTPMENSSLDSLPQLPPLDTLMAWTEGRSPALAAAAKDLAAARVKVHLEERIAVPAFNLSVGYERESEGDNLVGGGIEMPLALFNRNQTGVQKAKSDLRAAELRKAAEEASLKAEVRSLHDRLKNLSERYVLYQGQVRELIRKQLSLSEKGFREGLLGVFDLSRVQAEYLNQEGEALDILAEYYREWNRLSKAVGGRI